MIDRFELAYNAYNNAIWRNGGDSKAATYSITTIDNKLFICFQETYSKVDILADLFFFPRHYKKINALVHGGFYGQFEKVKEDILLCIDNGLENPIVDEIIIYGHSLGGAHALYLKQLLEHIRVKATVFCITTGCPRAFYWSPEFEILKTRFNNTICYVNGADAVPYLPVGFTNAVKHTRIGKFNIKKFFTGVDHLRESYYNEIMGDVES